MIASMTPYSRSTYHVDVHSRGGKDTWNVVSTISIDSDSVNDNGCCDALDVQSAATSAPAKVGDIVTIDLQLSPENGFIPEPLFDTNGRITFVLGWGNYLPGMHQLVEGRRISESVQNVSIDAGWGARRKDLIFRIAAEKLRQLCNTTSASGNSDDISNSNSGLWIPGETTLQLRGGLQVLVVSIDKDGVVIDANLPLAGSSYACSFTIIDIVPGFSTRNEGKKRQNSSFAIIPKESQDSARYLQVSEQCPSHYQLATFALGCFWGAELAFMRTCGVVATRAGYTPNGNDNKTHLKGGSRREAVLVLFDERVVSFDDLVQVALIRLRESQDPRLSSSSSTITSKSASSSLSPQDKLHHRSEEDDELSLSVDLSELFRHADDDDDRQWYRNGIYYHNSHQRNRAEKLIAGNRYGIDLLPASFFYDADENEQQYLYKGGQSARKDAKEKIRCFG